MVGTRPIKHSWKAANCNIESILDNIAAAAHACNINKMRWTQECFVSPDDCLQFLDYLHDYKGHMNSYWFYALLDIAEVPEERACNSQLLAACLYEQAIQTKQLAHMNP